MSQTPSPREPQAGSGPRVPATRRQRIGAPRWLAHPALSVLLALVWLLLQESLEFPQILTAIIIGLVVPRLAHGFMGPALTPRRWAAVVRFTFIVVWDIVVSNLTVARIVLSPASNPRPAWVRVPLDIKQPGAITLLATIITTTPGTVSCVVDDEAGEILVHALDCDDAEAMAAQIKQRYEQPLKEIFG
jgi:multicomponent K+:H+ antiporter subunit E